jgi:hypothetical protein
MNRSQIARLTTMLVAGAAALALSGCAPIHEPWVNNGKQWKEQHFRSNVSNAVLDQRLLTGQSDR